MIYFLSHFKDKIGDIIDLIYYLFFFQLIGIKLCSKIGINWFKIFCISIYEVEMRFKMMAIAVQGFVVWVNMAKGLIRRVNYGRIVFDILINNVINGI